MSTPQRSKLDWKNWEKFYFLGKEERALFNRALNRRRKDSLRDRRLSASEFCREVILAYCSQLTAEAKSEPYVNHEQTALAHERSAS